VRIAKAQTYPARPVRLIIGFPAGGGADIVARILGRWLAERVGQEVIIENKPGANTSIAAQTVVNSPSDGYTLLWCGVSNAINATFYENLPFNFLKDIAPVSGAVVYPLVLEVHPSVPAKNVAEFITLAKANPGKINMASFGTGSVSHLAGELFKMRTGINVIHVPFRGAAPMLTDLLGGQVGDRYRRCLTSAHQIGGATPIGCDNGRAPRRITARANCWRNSCRLRGRLDRHRRPERNAACDRRETQS
jgi:tripartite-type tricarboxylate transporter receptor subunit TctC